MNSTELRDASLRYLGHSNTGTKNLFQNADAGLKTHTTASGKHQVQNSLLGIGAVLDFPYYKGHAKYSGGQAAVSDSVT